MGGAIHTYGTRFVLTLESSEGPSLALYRAEVRRPDTVCTVVLEILPAAARIVSGGEGLGTALAEQLIALAKTVGRRADAAPWPRRIQRWRPPGVR